MIKVTVELDSAIHKSRDKILGIMTITNDGILSVETCGRRASYDVKISKKGKQVNQTLFECKVENFPRKTSNVWDLIYEALHLRKIAKKGKKKKKQNDFDLNDTINSMVSDKSVGELKIINTETLKEKE